MKRELNSFYRAVENNEIEKAWEMGDMAYDKFLQKKIQKKLIYEPGKNKTLIIKMGNKVVNLQDYLKSRYDSSMRFEGHEEFLYRYQGMGQKYVHYDKNMLLPDRHINGTGQVLFHEISHALNHNEESRTKERLPYDLAKWTLERNAWLRAIRELDLFKNNTGIDLCPEFDERFTLYDQANIFLYTYMTRAALKDILNIGSHPLINSKSE